MVDSLDYLTCLNGTALFSGGGGYGKSNYRKNLAELTGKNPKDSHAHHVFPQAKQFREFFEKVGINIHDPKYLQWWEKGSRLRNARSYNEAWDDFIFRNPTASADQIIKFGRSLMKSYGKKVNF